MTRMLQCPGWGSVFDTEKHMAGGDACDMPVFEWVIASTTTAMRVSDDARWCVVNWRMNMNGYSVALVWCTSTRYGLSHSAFANVLKHSVVGRNSRT